VTHFNRTLAYRAHQVIYESLVRLGYLGVSGKETSATPRTSTPTKSSKHRALLPPPPLEIALVQRLRLGTAAVRGSATMPAREVFHATFSVGRKLRAGFAHRARRHAGGSRTPPMHTVTTLHAAPVRMATPQPARCASYRARDAAHMTPVHVMTTVRPTALRTVPVHPAPAHATPSARPRSTPRSPDSPTSRWTTASRFIGSDHRLYLLAANGAYGPPRWTLSHRQRRLFHFAHRRAIDPGTLRAFLGSRTRSS